MINIIAVKEQNEFYNASKINNGGGYAQPIVLFEVNGTPGFYQDLSCGDFGKRFKIKFDNRIYECDEVSKFSLADYEYYSEFGEEYIEFIEEFENVFGVRILTKSETEQ